MNRAMKRLLLSAILGIGSATGLSAQTMIQVPPLLEESDPRGPVVRGLATRILTGDRQAAEAYLLERAASGYDKAKARAELSSVIEKLQGGYEVFAVRQGEDGAVLVPMKKKGDPTPSLILVVGMEAAAPHRVTQLQVVPLQIRDGA